MKDSDTHPKRVEPDADGRSGSEEVRQIADERRNYRGPDPEADRKGDRDDEDQGI